MRPRTIAIVGAAIIAAGFLVQQLLVAGASTGMLVRGTQLDQTLLTVMFGVGDTVSRIAVPLGSAVVGGGLVLWLSARRPASASPEPAATPDREPEWLPPTDGR
ncbi:hypothetical protein [Agrococcus jejuensis]|uniref:Uncharacterized protein n=1 Tax=Agrococcus jejuensis TaxID=399736 RepID=A0A1G8EI44_9MICO|nr:hypothetical protein [Agrococcus jejuensis]SDH69470.1 hypothetical protein SAMN04489720_2047 [Agrococcus jejuensis]